MEYDDWTNVFYHTEESVTKADFAVTNNGNLNLNDATLHYHMGHGHEDWLLETHHSWIPLTGWPFGADTLVDHTDVDKKWTDKNKWVFIDSCDVLIDKQWGGALKTSHGILGYSSYKWTSDMLLRIFFDNAVTNNRSITQSYYIATKEAQTGPLATVIFDDPYQFPDDDIVYYAEWCSGSGGSGAGGRQQGLPVQSTIIQSAIGEVKFDTTLPPSPAEIPILAATVNPGDIIRNWSEDLMDEQHNVTSEADAPQVALNILQTEGGGLPQGAILSSVNTTYLYGYNTETEEFVNGSPLLTSVQYRREINGMPVGGRGGLIDISLGEDGKNLGLLKVWRTASDAGAQKIIPVDAAVEKLMNGDLSELPREGMNVTVNDIKLGYFEKGANEQQAFFEPVWIFYGDLDSGESIALYIYARKFANFTVTPLIASTGDPITFTDTSETTTIKWYWDFGDGTNSTLKNPVNSYTTGGNYTVNLTVWNEFGSDSFSRQEYITIYPDAKPSASFTSNYSWDNIHPPIAISFNDTSVGYLTNWSWDFGDGTNSTEQSPTHVFNLIPGDVDDFYGINLTVTDRYGRTSMSYDTIYVQMDYHPNFTAEPTRGLAPLNVTFTDISPPLNNIDALWWDFGDGTYFDWYNEGTGGTPPKSVSHEYTTDGNYSVTLSIMPSYHSEMSFQSIKEDLIYVGSVYPPNADFTSNVTSGKIPLAVTFTDATTGTPASWNWSFGDGIFSDEQNPVHSYILPGTYTVSLKATNIDGSDSEIKPDYILVQPLSPPVASFNGNPLTGKVPLTVVFNDTSSGSPASWFWDFGDGTTSAEQDPVHEYIAGGNYTVSLTAANEDGSDIETRVDYITGKSRVLPNADFNVNTTTGTVPLVVEFTDTSAGSPTGWSWTFGDGSISQEQNPVHVYTITGQFTVTLQVTNEDGSNTTTKEQFITGSTVILPVADFIGNTTSGIAPLAVGFTDQSTGSPVTWNWTFGDGATSDEQNPEYTYTDTGTYTVSLEATNPDSSNTTTKTDYITVTSDIQPPVASFTGKPTYGKAPLTVKFNDTSTRSPTSWSWDFGDGTTATEQNPVHIYTTAEKYTVSLTATNAGGSNTKTRNEYITAQATPPPTANFYGKPTSGKAPLAVKFTDSSTGSPTGWYWEFGDGTTDTAQHPVHSFTAAGKYTVSLTASNAAGNTTKTRTEYITVKSTTPTPTCTPSQCEPHEVPQVTGNITQANKVRLDWNVITNPCLQGYKVVISKNNPNPKYPDDGYMFWITNRNTNYSVISSTDHYNGGDFGGYLQPGQSYYFSITAVHSDTKVAGNVAELVYPS